MRIYYFGELIKDTNKKSEKIEILEQTTLELAQVHPEQNKKVGMESIGELLQELDMSLDNFKPRRLNGAQG